VPKSFEIPIICGPTASGKTGLALKLAADRPVEIVNADSRQIIRYLDIGTAKPTEAEQARAPFHLVDIIDPGERYNAFRFLQDANRIVGEILKRDATPLVVGGTGLYLRALTEGVVEISSTDMTIRARLEEEMEELGAAAMHERLQNIDPLEAAKVHRNNRNRIIRALEIFYLTGKPKSELIVTGAYKKSEQKFRYFCLMPDRQQLYETINARVDQMMDVGLLAEIQTLVEEGWKPQLRTAHVIGYDELLDHIDGRSSLEDAVALMKQNSRKYAKRQMTWYRHLDKSCQFADRDALLTELRDSLDNS
jgi:tRNA dimethylallyltransferase